MSARRRAAAGTAVGAILIMAASTAWASSHREAPGITEEPKVDATDLYLFRSYEPGRQKYVTLIANYQPLQEPFGGPNYFTMDEDAIYEIHIDNDGDAIEDITFEFNFDNDLAADGEGISLNIGGETVPIPLRQAGPITARDMSLLNERESYTLTMITGDRRSGTRRPVRTGNGEERFTKPIDYIGEKTLPNYEAYANRFIYTAEFPGCNSHGRVFVGQREEAFAVNLGEIFDLVNLVPLQGGPNPRWPEYSVAEPFPGGIVQDRENDDLVGEYNITSLAIEVPIDCVTQGDEPVIGAWTTASLPQGEVRDPSPTYETWSVFGGAWVQRSRLSNPLVNEVIIGLPDKNLFNASEPMNDSQFATYVTNPTLPALLDALFRDAVGASGNIAPSNFPRNDLVATFLTGFPGLNAFSGDNAATAEMMRLNTAIPPTPRDAQHPFGVVAEDLAGFPNGRRPGDDTVDIALRVVMGALCHDVPLGAELGVQGAKENTDSDLVNLGLCDPEDAPVGTAPFTDGAPITADELMASFPYLNTPIPGSPQEARDARGVRLEN